MEFIKDLTQDKYKECLFCSLNKSKDDRASLVLKRGKTCYIVLNRYPYNNGHMMIVPYRHIGNLSELTPEEGSEMISLTGRATDILKTEIKADGFNAGFNLGRVAGAGIEGHIHFHLVPRWNGDHNFFPVLGETRSMPQYLEETYDHLVKSFQ